MSAQNIAQLARGFAKTAGQIVSSFPSVMIENETDSFEILRIVSLRITNIDTENSYPITATIMQDGFVVQQISSNLVIPPTATLILLSRDSQIWLEEGQALWLQTNTDSKLEAVCSYDLNSKEEVLLFTTESLPQSYGGQNVEVFSIYENSTIEFTFNVPNKLISDVAQFFYWKIIDLSNTSESDFVAMSGELSIPANGTTHDFNIETTFVGNPNKLPNSFLIQIAKNELDGVVIYQSTPFTIVSPVIQSSHQSGYDENDNPYIDFGYAITNVGTRVPITVDIINEGTSNNGNFLSPIPNAVTLVPDGIAHAVFIVNVAGVLEEGLTLVPSLSYNQTFIYHVDPNSAPTVPGQYVHCFATFTNENVLGGQTVDAGITTFFDILENSRVNFVFSLEKLAIAQANAYWKIHHIADSEAFHFVSTGGSFTIPVGGQTASIPIDTKFIGQNNRTASQWKIQILVGGPTGQVVYETGTFRTNTSVTSASWNTLATWKTNPTILTLTVSLSQIGTLLSSIPITVETGGTSVSSQFTGGFPTAATITASGGTGTGTVTYPINQSDTTTLPTTLYASLYAYGNIIWDGTNTVVDFLVDPFETGISLAFSTPDGYPSLTNALTGTFSIQEWSHLSLFFETATSLPIDVTLYWTITHVSNSQASHFVATSGSFVLSQGTTSGQFSIDTNFIGINNRISSQWKIEIRQGSITGTSFLQSSTFSTISSTITASWSSTTVTESNSLNLNIGLTTVGTRTQYVPVTLQYAGTATDADFVGGRLSICLLQGGSGTVTTTVGYTPTDDYITETSETMSVGVYYGGNLLVNSSNNPVTIYDLFDGTALVFTNENVASGASTNGQGGSTYTILENSNIVCTYSVTNNFTANTTLYWKINHVSNSEASHFATDTGSFVINSGSKSGTFTVATNFIGVSTRTASQWKIQVWRDSLTGYKVYETSLFSTIPPTWAASWSNTSVMESKSLALNVTLSSVGTKTATIPISIDNSGTASSSDFTGGWPTTANIAIGSNSIAYGPYDDNVVEGNETLSASLAYNGNTLISASNNPVTITDYVYNPTRYVTAGRPSLVLGETATSGTPPTGWFILRDNTGTGVTPTGWDTNNTTRLITPEEYVGTQGGNLSPYFSITNTTTQSEFRMSGLWYGKEFFNPPLIYNYWRIPMPNFGRPSVSFPAYSDGLWGNVPSSTQTDEEYSSVLYLSDSGNIVMGKGNLLNGSSLPYNGPRFGKGSSPPPYDSFSVSFGENNYGNLKRLLIGIDPSIASNPSKTWNDNKYIILRYETTTSIYEVTFYSPEHTNMSPNTNRQTDEGFYKWKIQIVTGTTFGMYTSISSMNWQAPWLWNGSTSNFTQATTGTTGIWFPEENLTDPYTQYGFRMPAGDDLGYVHRYNASSYRPSRFGAIFVAANKSYVVGIGKLNSSSDYPSYWGGSNHYGWCHVWAPGDGKSTYRYPPLSPGQTTDALGGTPAPASINGISMNGWISSVLPNAQSASGYYLETQ